MDPKETKTFESNQPPNLNQTSSKTQKTQHIPGVMPMQPSITKTQLESESGFWTVLRKPMRLMVKIVVPILILALLGSGLFNLVQGMMKGDKAPKEIVVDRFPKAEAPPTTSSSSPIVSTTTKNECMDLPTRMTQSKIDTKQVDKVFYQKYPDRMNKALGDTQLDRNLRQEWCAIGNRLSNTQPPNTVR
jgi:hypothetical protein